ncbi:MAG TPA: hypothetical protein P5077_01225 [bacterium]|nr:hypothetical protein [bacterium]
MSALLFSVILCASEALLKSDITVEPGVYKKGWERDFFRDLPPHDPPEESTDAVPIPPDTDAINHRRAVTAPCRMPTPTVTPEPAVDPTARPAANPEEKDLDDTPPSPREERRAPRRPPEPVILPDRTPEEETSPAAGTPAADPEKKRKERLREMENKRKKGNFRDPKLTY